MSVGAGLIMSGIGAYVFLIIGRHALGKEAFGTLNQLWFATFALTPGFFLPLEQELGRALSHRRTLGEGARPLVRRAAILGAVLVLLVVVVLLALSPFLVKHVFHGNVTLMFGLILAVIGGASAHFFRGMFAGTGRFAGYGIVFGADGFFRVALSVVLAIIGVKAVGAYGLLVGIPPFIALSLAWPRNRLRFEPGPEAPWSELTPNLGWLLLGSVAAAFLVNAGPLAANLLATSAEKKTIVPDFNSGVLISRVPLFLFQAVQAALLPKLTRLATSGAYGEFRSGFRKLVILVSAVAVAGTVGAMVIGPFVLRKMFSASLTSLDLGLLALAAGLYMLAVAYGQAVIALHGHARVGVGWSLGFGSFAATLALGGPLLRRVEIALTIGCAVSLVAFVVSFRAQLAKGESPDATSMFEALQDRPVEP